MDYLRQVGWRPIAVLAAVLGVYLLACIGLWRFQTKLIFFPPAVVQSTPADFGMPYENLRLSVRKGQIHGWWIPFADDTANSPVIIYAHGNGSNLGDLVSRFQRFHTLGYAVMAIDYRGYGQSSGPFPNEQRVYEDIEAAWQYLVTQRQIAANRIVVYGQSIGGAIALNLAINHPDAAGLIMESPFTSMRDMVDHKYPLLPKLMPIEIVLTQRFDSVQKVRSLKIPLLLIHGTEDDIVPAFMSQLLYGAAIASSNANSTLVLVEGGDHNGLPSFGRDRYSEPIQTFVQMATE